MAAMKTSCFTAYESAGQVPGVAGIPLLYRLGLSGRNPTGLQCGQWAVLKGERSGQGGAYVNFIGISFLGTLGMSVKLFGCKAKRDIEAMCADAWRKLFSERRVSCAI
jgi:hypothetical protein